MKTLAIFGATGSIGDTALKVYKNNRNKFKLLYLSANKNYRKLKKLDNLYKPKKIILTDKKLNLIKSKIDKKILFENDLYNKNIKKIDYVISGVSGYDALDLNLKLVRKSKKLLLANKETIICGGDYLKKYALKHKCKIIPIDSEHYCINFFLKNFSQKNFKQINNFYLIASGGPFLNKKFHYDEPIRKVIRHPNWKMGKKISVDSSNFANKVLELFEAKILFNIPSNKIKISIEEKSNVHAIIEFKNNIYFPIVHNPNMLIPISDGLDVFNNLNLNLNKLKIKFTKPNQRKFPIIKLGYDILKLNNHVAMILFTIFNERLVKKFINNQIKYGDIANNLVKIFKNKEVLHLLKRRVQNYNDIKLIVDKGNKIKIL